MEKILLFLVFILVVGIHSVRVYGKWDAPNKQILSGGDDWLTYETQARSMILNRDLLNKAYTGSSAFWRVPYYRYFVAFAHVVGGENVFMVVFLQYILMGFSVILTYSIGKKIYDRRTGVISVVILIAFDTVLRKADVMLPETAGMLLSLLAIFFLAVYNSNGNKNNLVLSGVFYGIAIGVRPNLFPFLLFMGMWLLLKHGKDSLSEGVKCAVIYVSVTFIMILPIAVRNYHVSKKLVLFSTHGPAALLAGNPVPSDVDLEKIYSRKVYSKINIDENLRRVAEYVIQRPKAFITWQATKFLYFFGVDFDQPDPFLKIRLLIPAILMGVGVVLFRKNRQNLSIKILMFLFVIVNTFVISAICPIFQYGNRYLLPTLPIVYIIGASSVTYFARRFRDIGGKARLLRWGVTK